MLLTTTALAAGEAEDVQSFRRPHDWASRSGPTTPRSGHVGHTTLPSPLSMPERSSARHQVRRLVCVVTRPLYAAV